MVNRIVVLIVIGNMKSKTHLILQILKQCGNFGCHSFDLNSWAHTTRAAARVYDLKRQGYSIASQGERRGRAWGVRYFFIGSPAPFGQVAEQKLVFDSVRQVFVYQ